MSNMNIVCLDLEGVLVPEIWIAFSEASGIPELRRTTRDEPDYDKLMKYRIAILKEHGLGLKEIQETIAKINPMDGAKELLEYLFGKYKIYAATNAIYHQQINRLTKAGIIKYFDNVFVSEKIGYQKPTKAFFDCC